VCYFELVPCLLVGWLLGWLLFLLSHVLDCRSSSIFLACDHVHVSHSHHANALGCVSCSLALCFCVKISRYRLICHEVGLGKLDWTEDGEAMQKFERLLKKQARRTSAIVLYCHLYF
jgi:hypothetical protein